MMVQSLKYPTTILQTAILRIFLQDPSRMKINTIVSFVFEISSDRGQCHFYDQVSNTTTLWQTFNLSLILDPLLIDNHSVWFNLTAWIGGFLKENDNVQVSLTFFNQVNQTVGNMTTIGPVLAADRYYRTLLFLVLSPISFFFRIVIQPRRYFFL
jgi:hypothetical protein